MWEKLHFFPLSAGKSFTIKETLVHFSPSCCFPRQGGVFCISSFGVKFHETDEGYRGEKIVELQSRLSPELGFLCYLKGEGFFSQFWWGSFPPTQLFTVLFSISVWSCFFVVENLELKKMKLLRFKKIFITKISQQKKLQN